MKFIFTCSECSDSLAQELSVSFPGDVQLHRKTQIGTLCSGTWVRFNDWYLEDNKKYDQIYYNLHTCRFISTMFVGQICPVQLYLLQAMVPLRVLCSWCKHGSSFYSTCRVPTKVLQLAVTTDVLCQKWQKKHKFLNVLYPHDLPLISTRAENLGLNRCHMLMDRLQKL